MLRVSRSIRAAVSSAFGLFCMAYASFHRYRGFGKLPKGLPQQAIACEGTSKIPILRVASERGFYGKGTPFLCLLRKFFVPRKLDTVVDVFPARIG